MKSLRKSFPDSTVRQFANATGNTIKSGAIIDLGGLGWGVVIADVLDGNVGSAQTRGRFKLPKDAAAMSQGQAVDWDGTKLVVAVVGKPIGVLSTAALLADASGIIELNEGPEIYRAKIVGDASGAGLTINTGWGVAPAGPILIQSMTNAGVYRAATSMVISGGGDAGKIVLVTAAGAATDVHHVLIHRN